MTETILVHHGILGQKWGVRRFQNEDGTLTPAGKKRYVLTSSTTRKTSSSSSSSSANSGSRAGGGGAAGWTDEDVEATMELEKKKQEMLRELREYGLGNIPGLTVTYTSLGLTDEPKLYYTYYSKYQDREITFPEGTKLSKIRQTINDDARRTGDVVVEALTRSTPINDAVKAVSKVIKKAAVKISSIAKSVIDKAKSVLSKLFAKKSKTKKEPAVVNDMRIDTKKNETIVKKTQNTTVSKSSKKKTDIEYDNGSKSSNSSSVDDVNKGKKSTKGRGYKRDYKNL